MIVTKIEPTSGPVAGGTVITFTGTNLGIGNRIIDNVVFAAFGKTKEDNTSSMDCKDAQVVPK